MMHHGMPDKYEVRTFRRIRDRFALELSKPERAAVLSHFTKGSLYQLLQTPDSLLCHLFLELLLKRKHADAIIEKVNSLADARAMLK